MIEETPNRLDRFLILLLKTFPSSVINILVGIMISTLVNIFTSNIVNYLSAFLSLLAIILMILPLQIQDNIMEDYANYTINHPKKSAKNRLYNARKNCDRKKTFFFSLLFSFTAFSFSIYNMHKNKEQYNNLQIRQAEECILIKSDTTANSPVILENSEMLNMDSTSINNEYQQIIDTTIAVKPNIIK